MIDVEKMATVSACYIEGIKEGRKWFDRYGMDNVLAHLENLDSTIRGFAASTPVGQLLRGERDFWRNQLALSRQLSEVGK